MKYLIFISLTFFICQQFIYAQENKFTIGIFDAWKGYESQPNGNKTNLDKINSNSDINTIQSYAYWNVWDHGTLQDVDAFLNQASGLGLKVLLCIPFNSPDNETPFINRIPPDYNYAAQLINHTISSEAVYGYYIADEPCDSLHYQRKISPANLQKAYTYFMDLIKNQGKNRPLLIADDFSLWDPKPYSSCADIFINDTYIVDNDAKWSGNLNKLDSLIIKTGPSKSVQSLIAAFSEGASNKKNNYNQIRFQIFTSIIHGTKGIWFYSYKDSYEPPEINYIKPSEYFQNVISPVTGEIKEINDFLFTQNLGSYITGVKSGTDISPNNTNIEYAIKKINNDYLIIAANLSGKEITLDDQTGFNLGNLSRSDIITQCSVIGESRDIVIHNRVLVDTFGSYSVHIYLINP